MIANDEQIEFILADLSDRGIKNEELKGILLDHVCCILEHEEMENESFEKLYNDAICTFFELELTEIESHIALYSKYKNHLSLTRETFFRLIFFLLIAPILIINLMSVSWVSSGPFIPVEIWGASVAYGAFPIMIFLVIWLTPEKLDPLIPRKSVVVIGIHPLFDVIKC